MDESANWTAKTQISSFYYERVARYSVSAEKESRPENRALVIHLV